MGGCIMKDEAMGVEKEVGAATVEGLHALSRAVGDWGVKCSEGSEDGWMWYGRLCHDVEEIREVLIKLTRGEKAERDWDEALLKPGNRNLVVERLHELRELIADWAGMCEEGELKGWMACGELRLHVEEIRDLLGVSRTSEKDMF